MKEQRTTKGEYGSFTTSDVQGYSFAFDTTQTTGQMYPKTWKIVFSNVSLCSPITSLIVNAANEAVPL